MTNGSIKGKLKEEKRKARKGHLPRFNDKELLAKSQIWFSDQISYWCQICQEKVDSIDNDEDSQICPYCHSDTVIPMVNGFTLKQYADALGQIGTPDWPKRSFTTRVPWGKGYSIDPRIYNFICSMRSQGEDYWIYLVKKEVTKSINGITGWALLTYSLWSKWKIIMPWYHKTEKVYRQLTFRDKEWVDWYRATRGIYHFETVLQEMESHDERILVTDANVREALQAAKDLRQEYITNGINEEEREPEDT